MRKGPFFRFADVLTTSFDAIGLQEALTHVGAATGFPLFAYLIVSNDGQYRPSLISNYDSEWTSRYFNRRYDNIDPVIIGARQLSDPFSWGSLAVVDRLLPKQHEFFEEARNFGIHGGFTIPLASDDKKFAVMTFASGENAKQIQHSIAFHESALQLIGILFHRRAEMLALGGRQIAGVSLTKREIECLSWAARGKSAWDTAQIIGIAPRTVTYHLDNIRTKFKVKTITQAVAIFASHQSDQPISLKTC